MTIPNDAELTSATELASSVGENPDDDITLSIPGSNILTGPPRVSFTSAVADFAKDVLKEASNLESAERNNDPHKPREFHSKHVEKAAIWVRDRGAVVAPRSRWYVVGRIFQALSVLGAGLSLTEEVLPRTWAGWSYTFTALLALTVFLTVLIEVLDWRARK